MRISDHKKLTDENVIKGSFKNVITKKTGVPVEVPLAPQTRLIMAKYGNKLPPKHLEQDINEEIKKVALKAGLTDIIKFIRTVGGSLKTFKFKKYELITNHTARRTFITFGLENGIPADIIAELAGCEIENVKRYDKRSKSKIAQLAIGYSMFAKA